MRRILLTIGYKGTNYSGFQIQNNANTIQQELENAIKKVCNHNVTVFASGRTDAGVHALKQTVHFDTESNIKEQNLVNGLNTFLPSDIRVFEARQVDESFHARFNAKKKTYMYIYSLNQIVNPVVYDLVSPLKYQIDMELVKKAINLLKGSHNFKAFCSSGTSVTNFNKTIFDITVEEKDEYLIFKVTGNGFLYNMVRIIMGTIVDIARGKLALETITKMFDTGDRSLGGSTASQCGLYLYDVEY